MFVGQEKLKKVGGTMVNIWLTVYGFTTWGSYKLAFFLPDCFLEDQVNQLTN